jgi:putative endonuclease
MTVMYLYLLKNNISKVLYIGITNDIDRRLKEHNKKNRHFTGRVKGVWIVLGFKEFEDENLAKKEEHRLKKSKNKNYINWYFTNKKL